MEGSGISTSLRRNTARRTGGLPLLGSWTSKLFNRIGWFRLCQNLLLSGGAGFIMAGVFYLLPMCERDKDVCYKMKD